MVRELWNDEIHYELIKSKDLIVYVSDKVLKNSRTRRWVWKLSHNMNWVTSIKYSQVMNCVIVNG